MSWRRRDEPHDLGEFAVGVAAIGVHLPQSILRGDVTLRNKQSSCEAASMWGTPCASRLDGDRGGECGRALRCEMDIALEHWKRRLGGGTKPEDEAPAQHHKDRQQPNDCEENQPAASAAYGSADDLRRPSLALKFLNKCGPSLFNRITLHRLLRD